MCRAKRIAKEQAQEVHNEVKKADFVKKKENKYERKQCGKCGGIHEYRRCPAFGKECNKCRRVYHFARVCRSQKGNVHRKRRGCVNMVGENNLSSLYSLAYAGYLHISTVGSVC